MTLSQACNIYISVNQKDDRIFMYSNNKPSYSFSRLLLAQVTPNELKFCGGDFKEDQVLTIEAFLQAGEYLILIEIDWKHDCYRDIILSEFF